MESKISPLEAARQLLKNSYVQQTIKPKVYKNVEAFFDCKTYYYNMALTFFASKTESKIRQQSISDEAFYLNLIELSNGLKFNFPFFFVKPQLLEAADNTEINFVVEWDKIHLPFDSMTFILPRNYLITVDNASFSYIHITKCPKPDALDYQSEFANHNGVIISASDSSLSHCTVFAMTKDYTPNRTSYLVDGISTPIPLIQRRIIHIAVNLIFAMAARPELIESGQKLGRHKKSNSEIWSPNIIGRKYTVKRPDGYEANENGTPKRMHWRRGHFRQQPFGKGLLERKIIWLEPVLVGVKNAEV